MKKYFMVNIGKSFNFYDLVQEISISEAKESDLIIFLRKDFDTFITKNKLKRLLILIFKLLDQVDLFYLSYSMEKCEDTKVFSSWENINLQIPEAPQGFFSLASTKGKWKDIINKMNLQNEKNISDKLSTLVSRGEIKALSTWPRIYEPTTMDGKNYLSGACRDSTNNIKIKKDISFYYFCFSFVFFSIFLIYLYKNLRKYYNKNEKINTENPQK